jgi:hypothetical protein
MDGDLDRIRIVCGLELHVGPRGGLAAIDPEGEVKPGAVVDPISDLGY